MAKKYKFSAQGGSAEALKDLEGLPLVGGFIKGLAKLIDLAEKVEEAGGEIKKKGEIKGEKGQLKGVYGFSIRTGIGGRPSIQTFGNIKPVKEKKKGKPKFKATETREPLADIFDEKDHILIIAELPGATKESISLNLKDDILILEAGNQTRKYSKEILLPAKVDFERKKVSFKNGVLEVNLKKL